MDIKKYLIVMIPAAILVFSLYFRLDGEFTYWLFIPIVVAWVSYYTWKHFDKKPKK